MEMKVVGKVMGNMMGENELRHPPDNALDRASTFMFGSRL